MEVLDFVGDKDRMTHQRIADAKAVCATCTQVEPCLAFAIAGNEHGVWGGTTRRSATGWRRPGRPTPMDATARARRAKSSSAIPRAYRRRQREKGCPRDGRRGRAGAGRGAVPADGVGAAGRLPAHPVPGRGGGGVDGRTRDEDDEVSCICGSTETTISQAGVHIKEACAGCGRHIRWVSKAEAGVATRSVRSRPGMKPSKRTRILARSAGTCGSSATGPTCRSTSATSSRATTA